MNNKNNKEIKDVSVDATSAAIGTGVGILVGGPGGAVIGGALGPVVKELLSRFLSGKEKTRIEFVMHDAVKKINEKIKAQASLRKDLDQKKLAELMEGTLIKASHTYEDRKLPFIANLLATAPFTATPFENLNQTLILAEQLSYQHLCILAVIGENSYQKRLQLSDKDWKSEYKEKGDEWHVGIYEGIAYLMQNNLIFWASPDNGRYVSFSGYGATSFVPNDLKLDYFGRMLFNGLLLSEINQSDLDPIIAVLKPPQKDVDKAL